MRRDQFRIRSRKRPLLREVRSFHHQEFPRNPAFGKSRRTGRWTTTRPAVLIVQLHRGATALLLPLPLTTWASPRHRAKPLHSCCSSQAAIPRAGRFASGGALDEATKANVTCQKGLKHEAKSPSKAACLDCERGAREEEWRSCSLPGRAAKSRLAAPANYQSFRRLPSPVGVASRDRPALSRPIGTPGPPCRGHSTFRAAKCRS